MPGLSTDYLAQFDAEASETASTISFFLNGSPISLDLNSIDPDATLLDFIRSQGQGFTGSKLGCNEGGCGACTIVLQSMNPRTKEIQHLAVNACLAPLVSVDGKHVITVEGLGNSENPHPLQERLWKLSGSQCGFCTPGIVMSIYAMLRTAAQKGQLTVSDVELEGVLDGNLCRCTGYKPILDAAKSFVGDYLSKRNGKGLPDFGDYIIPVNAEAANLEPGECKSACCSAPKVSDAEISTDGKPFPLTSRIAVLKVDDTHRPVSLPALSAKETSVPPIEPPSGAGALSRTAPVETPAVREALETTSAAPVKPKGCGRADCCQLPDNPSSSEFSGPRASFPRFTLKPYQPGTELIFPPSLTRHKLSALKYGSKKTREWYRPSNLNQLLALKKEYPDAKLVGGSSEVQIEVHFKNAKYQTCIYVSNDIPELAFFDYIKGGEGGERVEFGANLPLSELDKRCKDLLEVLEEGKRGPLNAIRGQLRYFAGFQIRNVASVGGGIATASPIADLNPIWVATDTKLIIQSHEEGEKELSMDQFFKGYRKTALPIEAVIVKIVVPLNEGVDMEVVKAYKQSKRKDDDIAIVTCCFLMKVSPEGKITKARFAYGGMAAWTITVSKTQDFLEGKAFTQETLDGALEVLGKEVDLPYNVPGGMPSYRKTLALSFFFKFWNQVSLELNLPFGDSPLSKIDQEDITSAIHRVPNTGRRDNEDPYAQEAVGRQEPHLSGLKHVTGEAVYVDDMPRVGNELYGGLVLSSHAHAKILSVDPSPALAIPGVSYWVDHKDLPNEKANFWGAAAIDEVFFAVDEVISHGQPIGMVLATSKILAQKAAKMVVVKYEPLPSIFTIEEAIEQNSFHTQYDRYIIRGDKIQDALAASEHVVEGTVRMGGQEHFYLETMAALVVPKLEGGEMEVFSSTQALTDAQRWVAQVTGVPRNRIVAKSKRLGGGFGGKETRSSHLTAICAVAAKKARRPVRCMLDRNEDIATTGQRHPCYAKYKCGFSADGKIHALEVDFYSNAGYSLDISGGVNDRALAHLENCFWIPNFYARARCCKTNTVSNTAYRGFGGPQGMIVSEAYAEAIADKLKMDIDQVRQANLYVEGQKTPYHQKVLDWHVPRMLDDCRRDSNYEERRVAVEAFNKEHRWRKRGISLLPTKFGLAFGVKAMNQGAALVHIYLDGSVLIAHGGTEMGQGLYTKCAQIAAQELMVPLEAIFNSESATNTASHYALLPATIVTYSYSPLRQVPNTVPTAGSAGSDLQGHAIFNACKELNERLAPFRKKLGSDASMGALAGAAWGDRVSLSATGYYATPELGYVWNCQEETGPLFAYFTQGVAACEVEIDVLTGDSTILRTDIHMDVGKSLNPAIDYGQIEGAYVQGQGWCTIEESLWMRHNGAIFTQGPGNYKIPGFSDIPQVFNVTLLKNATWRNLHSIYTSRGIGEPPFFLGCAAAVALRHAIKSARLDADITDRQEYRLPVTSERIRLACGDFLAKKGHVEQKEGEKNFFVYI